MKIKKFNETFHHKHIFTKDNIEDELLEYLDEGFEISNLILQYTDGERINNVPFNNSRPMYSFSIKNKNNHDENGDIEIDKLTTFINAQQFFLSAIRKIKQRIGSVIIEDYTFKSIDLNVIEKDSKNIELSNDTTDFLNFYELVRNRCINGLSRSYISFDDLDITFDEKDKTINIKYDDISKSTVNTIIKYINKLGEFNYRFHDQINGYYKYSYKMNNSFKNKEINIQYIKKEFRKTLNGD